MNDQKAAGTLDLLNPAKDLIIRKVLESKDELANVAIFKWLLDNDFSSVVLQVSRSLCFFFFNYQCSVTLQFAEKMVEENLFRRYISYFLKIGRSYF